jgi:GcrA cell cycle regulator
MNDIAATGGEKLTWTEERVDMLKKMWGDGLSASQIAGKIAGGVTRNAVIGKVHRLGLAGRQTAPRAPSSRSNVRKETRSPGMAQPRMPSQPSMPTAGANALKPQMHTYVSPKQAPLPEPKPMRLVDLSKDGRITILHLSDKTCKWPIGDPMHDDFCFCGHNPRDASPYCEYHARMAYQPAQDRRMRRAG